MTKDQGRQEKTVAIVTAAVAALVNGEGVGAIDLPSGALMLGGLLVVDTLFNSSTSDAFTVGDADDPDRYATSFGNEAFTAAAATDLLTTTSDFSNVVAVQVTSSASAPGGLVSGTTYYALNIDATHVSLAATEGGAAIDITSVGAGAFTLSDASEEPTFDDESLTPSSIAFEGGTDNQITVTQDITAATPLLFTVATDLPVPLSAGVVYFVSRISATTMKLLVSPGGAIVDITDIGSGTHTVHPSLVALVPTGKAAAKDVAITWTGTGDTPATIGSLRLIAEYMQDGRADFIQR